MFDVNKIHSIKYLTIKNVYGYISRVDFSLTYLRVNSMRYDKNNIENGLNVRVNV